MLYVSYKNEMVPYDPLLPIRNKQFFLKDREGIFHRLQLRSNSASSGQFCSMGRSEDLVLIKKNVNQNAILKNNQHNGGLQYFKNVNYMHFMFNCIWNQQSK